MKIRLTWTLHVTRDHADDHHTEYAPQVDVKGSRLIERSHQDEPNEMRTGATEPTYRAGSRPNSQGGE